MNGHHAHAEWMRAVLGNFTGQGGFLTIPKTLIAYCGSLERGLLLSQIIYWSDRTTDPDGWFYKTYVEWEEEITLSEYQVRRHTKGLQSTNLIETKLKKVHGSPTLHYRLNWRVFSDSFLEFLQNRTLRNFRNEGEETSGTNPKKLQEPPYIQRLHTTTTTPLTLKEGASEKNGNSPETEFKHPCAKTDDRYKQGSTLRPWETEPGKPDPEFIEWMAQNDKSRDNALHPKAKAKRIIDKSIREGTDLASDLWQTYQEEKAKAVRRSEPPSSASPPIPDSEIVTGEAAKAQIAALKQKLSTTKETRHVVRNTSTENDDLEF